MGIKFVVKRPGRSQPVRSIRASESFADTQLTRERRNNQAVPAIVAGVNNTSGKVIVKRPGSSQSLSTDADSSQLPPVPGKGTLTQRPSANQSNRKLTATRSGSQPGSLYVVVGSSVTGGEQEIGRGCRQASTGGVPVDTVTPQLSCGGQVGRWLFSFTSIDQVNQTVTAGNQAVAGNHKRPPVVLQQTGEAWVVAYDGAGTSEIARVRILGIVQIFSPAFEYDTKNPCYSQITTPPPPGGVENWQNGSAVR